MITGCLKKSKSYEGMIVKCTLIWVVFAYCGYLTRSGFVGSTLIQGTSGPSQS